MKTALIRDGLFKIHGALRAWKGAGRRGVKSIKEFSMLETILIILVVLWALGLFAFHASGLIHILLVIAAIVLVVRLLQGRRVL